MKKRATKKMAVNIFGEPMRSIAASDLRIGDIIHWAPADMAHGSAIAGVLNGAAKVIGQVASVEAQIVRDDGVEYSHPQYKITMTSGSVLKLRIDPKAPTPGCIVTRVS